TRPLDGSKVQNNGCGWPSSLPDASRVIRLGSPVASCRFPFSRRTVVSPGASVSKSNLLPVADQLDAPRPFIDAQRMEDRAVLAQGFLVESLARLLVDRQGGEHLKSGHAGGHVGLADRPVGEEEDGQLGDAVRAQG